MNQKRIPLTNEEPKYKKKSVAKGLPRSKHKHVYETVLLERDYHHTDFKTGADVVNTSCLPTKVCTICGRIDCTDTNQDYYVRQYVCHLPFLTYKEELSEQALALPKWRAADYFDKFAVKVSERYTEK